MDKQEITIITIITILWIFLVALIFFGVKAGNQRAVWLNEHCVKIGEISGSTSIGTGVGTNGSVAVVPVFTSGKTGYKCDDGLEYWEQN